MSLEMVEEGLNSEKLYAYLMNKRARKPVTETLAFYVLARHFLSGRGISDQSIADYIGSMLVEFGKENRAFQIAKYDDEVYSTLFDLYRDMEHDNGPRKYLVANQLANYSLWAAGLFPDSVSNLSYYDQMGIIGFKMCAVFPLAKQAGLDTIFEDILDSYSNIRMALNDMAANTNLVS